MIHHDGIVWIAIDNKILRYDSSNLRRVAEGSSAAKSISSSSSSSSPSSGQTDPASKKDQVVLEGHKAAIHCMCYVPSTDEVWSGGSDMAICIWDANTGELKDKFAAHESRVFTLLNVGSAWVWSGAWDTTIRVWNAARRELVVQVKGHNDAISDMKPISAPAKRNFSKKVSASERTLVSKQDKGRLKKERKGEEREKENEKGRDKEKEKEKEIEKEPEGESKAKGRKRLLSKPLHKKGEEGVSARPTGGKKGGLKGLKRKVIDVRKKTAGDTSKTVQIAFTMNEGEGGGQTSSEGGGGRGGGGEGESDSVLRDEERRRGKKQIMVWSAGWDKAVLVWDPDVVIPPTATDEEEEQVRRTPEGSLTRGQAEGSKGGDGDVRVTMVSQLL